MNVQISFVGHSRTNMNAYFPWSQACVCTKSRVAKILNVKVSFSVLFSYYVLAVGGGTQCDRGRRDKHEARSYSTCCIHTGPEQPPARKTEAMKIARGDARTCFSVRLQILIDPYICDQ